MVIDSFAVVLPLCCIWQLGVVVVLGQESKGIGSARLSKKVCGVTHQAYEQYYSSGSVLRSKGCNGSLGAAQPQEPSLAHASRGDQQTAMLRHSLNTGTAMLWSIQYNK
jgi:hypothetical protein